MRPVALVVGGSRRVGAATAIELARAGFDLLVSWRSDERGALEVSRHAEAMGVACRTFELDLATFDGRSLPAALDGARLDALVLNAAAWQPTPWGAIDQGSLHRLLQVNAVAPALLVQALANRLAASTLPGGGCVVAVGDAHAAGTPVRGYAGYMMSKAALHQLVQQLAAELAPRVRVNGVLPGVVAWPDDMPEASRASILQRVPLARAGEPADVARLVRFLCLEAPFITGALIPVDGGRSIR